MESKIKDEIVEASPEEESVFLTKEAYDGLKKKAAEADLLYDKLLRLQADFENYRKFTERQKAEYLKFGTQRILKELIKIYDDLKRAIKDHQDSPLYCGLKLILNNFSALLKSEGVVPIPAEGEIFNPDRHECMMVGDDPSAPEGTITEVFEEGYYLNGKVLRPSKVKIKSL